MTLRTLALALSLAGCATRTPGPPASPPVPVKITLKDPWALVSRTTDEIAVRYGDTPDGARVWLDTAQGHVPGVSPVHAGRTLEVAGSAPTWPLVAFAYPDQPVKHVEILVQGPDLVVRASGPPIRSVSGRADAPDDPVITWVRLRPRGKDWRIVMDGLGTVSFPVGGLSVKRTSTGYDLTATAGTLSLETNAKTSTTNRSTTRWSLNTEPALTAIQPYPRTAFTWTPAATFTP